MPDIDMRRPHALGLEAARAAAERMAEELRRKFGLSGDWSGNTLRFERPGISGALVVAESMVHITATLGFLMKAMKPSIEKAIESELERLVASASGRGAASKDAGALAAGKPAARPKTGRKPRK